MAEKMPTFLSKRRMCRYFSCLAQRAGSDNAVLSGLGAQADSFGIQVHYDNKGKIISFGGQKLLEQFPSRLVKEIS